MRNLKKLVVCISLLILIFIFTGCSYQKSIYEDDSKISRKADSSTFINRIGNTTNSKSSARYGSFNGMKTIWVIDTKGEGSLTLEYESQVNEGNFKLVIISPEDEVTTIFENDVKGKKTIETKSGQSRIKIVGKEASGEYSLGINSKSNVKVR